MEQVVSAVLSALGVTIVVMLARQQRAMAADRVQQQLFASREAARLIDGQLRITALLDTIHTLVNSNMTAAMQAEWDALYGQLALMDEVIELKRVAGREPSPQALEAVQGVQAKLTKLSAELRAHGHVPGIARFPEAPPPAAD